MFFVNDPVPKKIIFNVAPPAVMAKYNNFSATVTVHKTGFESEH